MKKIFFALAAVAVLAACSKSEVAYEKDLEISFLPVATNITKGMLTDNFLSTQDQFNVWAWYKQVPHGTAVSDWNPTANEHLYVDEGKFVHQEGSSWHGATPYYWPKVGSLLFAGYYPSELLTDEDIDYIFDSSTNKMVFTNIQAREVSSEKTTTEDLMYFNMTATSYNQGPVEVTFKHAMSWITVNLSRSDLINANTDGYPKVVVHSVKFMNVYTKGNAEVSGPDGKIVWNTIKDTEKDINVNVDKDKDGTKDDVVLSTDPSKQVEPIFIPQVFKNNMTIDVHYTVYSSANEHFTETYSAPLNKLKDKDSNTIIGWSAAKHYIYNISIGLDEILIEPEVAKWTEVTVNVPVDDIYQK